MNRLNFPHSLSLPIKEPTTRPLRGELGRSLRSHSDGNRQISKQFREKLCATPLSLHVRLRCAANSYSRPSSICYNTASFAQDVQANTHICPHAQQAVPLAAPTLSSAVLVRSLSIQRLPWGLLPTDSSAIPATETGVLDRNALGTGERVQN